MSCFPQYLQAETVAWCEASVAVQMMSSLLTCCYAALFGSWVFILLDPPGTTKTSRVQLITCHNMIAKMKRKAR